MLCECCFAWILWKLYGLRLQPEFELRLCVPSGLLHRSRQQGLRLLLRRRRHQVQIRQGGQDSSLLRNRQLLGNPEEEDQDQVQPTPEQKLPTTIAFEKEPQIATKQEPHTTTTIEEPQIATEQEPQNYNCTFTYTSIHPQGQEQEI